VPNIDVYTENIKDTLQGAGQEWVK
jgi:hypothetical protein